MKSVVCFGVEGDEYTAAESRSLNAFADANGVGRRVLSARSFCTVGSVLLVSVFLLESRFSFLMGTAFVC